MRAMTSWVAATAMLALSGATQAVPVFQGRLADGTASDTCTVWGPGKCTMFYNTTLDITILNDWGIGAGTWSATAAAGSAQALVESAGFAATGLSGWVLPTGNGDAPAGPQNQWLSIWDDVGYTLDGLFGQFDGFQWQDFRVRGYWSSTEYAAVLGDAWVFTGTQLNGPSYFTAWAVAVRPGDVAPAAVPEPQTLALALLALGTTGVASGARRRREHDATASRTSSRFRSPSPGVDSPRSHRTVSPARPVAHESP